MCRTCATQITDTIDYRRIEIQRYKKVQAYGFGVLSLKQHRSVASTHIVTTDFNALKEKNRIKYK